MAKKRPAAEAKQMRLTIPPDIHKRLRVAAAKVGHAMPRVVLDLLDRHLPKV